MGRQRGKKVNLEIKLEKYAGIEGFWAQLRGDLGR